MTREKKFDSVAKSSAIAVLEDELKIRSNVYAEYIYNLLNSDDKAAVDVAFEALREQGNCCKNGNSSWISVEDRLPEQTSRCLVARWDYVTKSPFVDILWFEKGTWWNRLHGGNYAVTHWMPLPTPPEVEG